MVQRLKTNSSVYFSRNFNGLKALLKLIAGIGYTQNTEINHAKLHMENNVTSWNY
jgi:hypothetical protein